MIDLKKFREVLESRKLELTELTQSGKSTTRPVALDQSIGRVTRIDAIQEQQMALASERRRFQELQRIEAALSGRRY